MSELLVNEALLAAVWNMARRTTVGKGRLL